MTDAAQSQNGVEKAAILLLTLGEAEAAEILKHMGAKDVQRVGTAMAELKGVSRDQVTAVLQEFVTAVDAQTSVGVGSDEFVRKVLVDALGEDKAAGLIDRIRVGGQRKGLEQLKWMDSRAVAELIRHEHPQIISIVLAYLESDQAAEVLGQLPENMRADLVMRVATLEGVRPSALTELDEILEKQFSGGSTSQTAALGGAKVAASMLNIVEASKTQAILADIAKTDEGLQTKIQDLMFVFDDLASIDDRGMQELLRQVPSDRLLVALKGAEEELKTKVFKNMSQRAAETLKEDLESRGPVKLSEVEGAQKEILLVARKLADAGTISLGGGGQDEYV
jgi:flagellar motor switch protein FliG